MPIRRACSRVIRSLKPVQRITGMPGRIFMISRASRSPVMFGMVMSVMTRSNRSGWARKSSSASMLLVRVSTR